MLLVHDVTAYESSVVIDDDGTVAAFTDGADDTLRDALRIVGITKFIQQLLLLVVGHDTFVRNGTPQVLVTVDINDAWYRLDTHTGKGLFHVTLKRLRLGVIDTIA